MCTENKNNRGYVWIEVKNIDASVHFTLMKNVYTETKLVFYSRLRLDGL